jgi:hypothetical protein
VEATPTHDGTLGETWRPEAVPPATLRAGGVDERFRRISGGGGLAAHVLVEVAEPAFLVTLGVRRWLGGGRRVHDVRRRVETALHFARAEERTAMRGQQESRRARYPSLHTMHSPYLTYAFRRIT